MKCPWCGKAVKPRIGGGRATIYCSDECKNTHYAARQFWAQEQEANGAVTVEMLKAALMRRRTRV